MSGKAYREWMNAQGRVTPESFNDTTRMHPRSMREAFREWGETAIGVHGPVVTPTRPSLLVRVLRWLLRVDA
jgi:hypothetical protein